MLDVRRLRVLREVAARGTLAAAAQALHLTPPAVSQQLAALEREAGAKLVERDGRSVRLTEAAMTLVAHTETILAQIEAAESQLAASEGSFGAQLRLGAFPSAIAPLLAPAVADLRAHHAALKVSVVELEPEQSLAALRLGELDIAVAHEYDLVPRRGDGGWQRHEFLREPLYLALPEGHPAAGAQAVPLTALADERWIAPPQGLTCLEEVERVCAAAGFAPVIESHCYSYDSTLALVAAGAGVALVPALAALVAPRGVALRPPADVPAARRVFAAVRRGAAARPSIATTLSALGAATAAITTTVSSTEAQSSQRPAIEAVRDGRRVRTLTGTRP